MAAEAGVVEAELRWLRQAPGPGLGGVDRVLDSRNDIVAILSWNVADLWQCSRPRPGPKLSFCALGNIHLRLHANERHTVHADIGQQS